MKNGKTIFLFIFAFVVIGAIFLGEMKFQSLATDSGFDAGYSGGGGFSGGSSSSSSSSSGGHSSPMTSEDMLLLGAILILANTIFLVGHLIKRHRNKEHFQLKSQKVIVGIVTAIFLFLSLLILLFFIFYIPEKIPGLLIILLCFLFWGLFIPYLLFLPKRKAKKKEIQTLDYLPLTEENENILKQGYQIYLDVQEAWMNFDYEKMKTLVTDEMFHMYQSQLQTLALKEQRNMMKDFHLIEYHLVKKEESNITTIQMTLKVSFYDYIIDNKARIVRGSKTNRIKMTYLLTFVLDENSIDRCPHCNAKIEKGSTTCSYCRTAIQGLGTTMKLSKKEALSQE